MRSRGHLRAWRMIQRCILRALPHGPSAVLTGRRVHRRMPPCNGAQAEQRNRPGKVHGCKTQGPRRTASSPSPRRFSSTMSAISCAIRMPRPARSSAPALPRRRSPCRSIPMPDGAPRLTGTGNVTAMFARGYIEALFKTADTPLGRELDGALARYRGVHLAAFAVADAATRIGGWPKRFPRAAVWSNCSGRSTPAGRRQRRPSRWRGSSPAKCRRAASRCSRTGPKHGLAAALAFASERRARASPASRSWSPTSEAARALRALHRRAGDPSPFGQTIELDRGRIELLTAGCLRPRSAGDADPVAALRRRLRDQGDVADAARRASAARRIASGGASEASSPSSRGARHGAWLFTE